MYLVSYPRRSTSMAATNYIQTRRRFTFSYSVTVRMVQNLLFGSGLLLMGGRIAPSLTLPSRALFTSPFRLAAMGTPSIPFALHLFYVSVISILTPGFLFCFRLVVFVAAKIKIGINGRPPP